MLKLKNCCGNTMYCLIISVFHTRFYDSGEGDKVLDYCDVKGVLPGG